MRPYTAALLACGWLLGLPGGPPSGVRPAQAAPGAPATPPPPATTPAPRRQGLTMDLVLAQVDRALAGQPGRFAHPIALAPSALGADRTLAPYFVVPTARDRGLEALPLESSQADVHIAGVIASVRVRQVYRNRGRRPIEAVYVFPASTRAAVHGMRLRVGTRTIEARVASRTQATRRFLRARRHGRRAALLLAERSNLLTLRVTHLMPGERVEVELDYSELLAPEEGVYELVIPTVAGPQAATRDLARVPAWLQPPRTPPGRPVTWRLGLDVRLEAPFAIQDVRSPSHPVTIHRPTPRQATISLVEPAAVPHDFVLRYRLAGGRLQTGALTYAEGGEQFFLLLAEPPRRVAEADRPPREIIVVLDVSGSMDGFPLETAKALLRALLATLRPQDRFNVVLFSGASHVLHPRSVPAEARFMEQALRVVGSQRGGGTTELLDALRQAYALPRPAARGLARSILVITDGYVGVEAETFRFVRRRLGEASCFAFGIGASVNRALIEGLARAGRGAPFVVTVPELAPGAAARLQRLVHSPVLSNIRLQVEGAQAYDLMPAHPPDLLAGRPLVVFGKLQGGPGRIRITGHTGAGPFTRTVALPAARSDPATRPLRALWARAWAQELTDQLAMLPRDQPLRDALRRLGLHYGLLTPLTGFVAVDRVRANRTGRVTEVLQPLPLVGSVDYWRRRISRGEAGTGGSATGTRDAVRKKSALYAYPASRRESFGGCHCEAPGGPRPRDRTPWSLMLLLPLLLAWIRRRRGGR